MAVTQGVYGYLKMKIEADKTKVFRKVQEISYSQYRVLICTHQNKHFELPTFKLCNTPGGSKLSTRLLPVLVLMQLRDIYFAVFTVLQFSLMIYVICIYYTCKLLIMLIVFQLIKEHLGRDSINIFFEK